MYRAPNTFVQPTVVERHVRRQPSEAPQWLKVRDSKGNTWMRSDWYIEEAARYCFTVVLTPLGYAHYRKTSLIIHSPSGTWRFHCNMICDMKDTEENLLLIVQDKAEQLIMAVSEQLTTLCLIVGEEALRTCSERETLLCTAQQSNAMHDGSALEAPQWLTLRDSKDKARMRSDWYSEDTVRYCFTIVITSLGCASYRRSNMLTHFRDSGTSRFHCGVHFEANDPEENLLLTSAGPG